MLHQAINAGWLHTAALMTNQRHVTKSRAKLASMLVCMALRIFAALCFEWMFLTSISVEAIALFPGYTCWGDSNCWLVGWLVVGWLVVGWLVGW
jgi:hypothetical protein